MRVTAALLLALAISAPTLGAEPAPGAAPSAKPAAAAAAQAPAAATPTNAECLQCHDGSTEGLPAVRVQAFGQSVHKDLDCVTCHVGYLPDGAHQAPQPTDPAEKALLARLTAGQKGGGEPRTRSPGAYLACAGCHAESVETFLASSHASWLREDHRKVAGPTCASCHGSPHEVTAAPPRKTPAFRAYSVKLSATCEVCHGDATFTEAAGVREEVPRTYRDSIHGRLVAIGSDRAPVCTDCHGWSVRPDLGKEETRRGVLPGGHATLSAPWEAVSTVSSSTPPTNHDHRVQTCAQCHRGATASFAGLISHRAPQETGRLPHFVHVMFSWLTVLTLLFFAFHVAVDFVFELRQRVARWRRHLPEPELAHRTVVRFDLHQRVQHWFMLSGVILLAITGWPLRGAGVGGANFAGRVASSRKFLAFFGGAHGAGVWHRVGAVLIIISGVYHLIYLAARARKRTLPFSMIPVPKDLFDLRDNVLFMLGLRKERPRFDRYNYMEKFDYWAVFWGIIMMVGSGFIFWFPVQFSRFLPTYVLTAAQIIHGEEATLAAIFLFVVHFYNVHLKPSIFPMNWTWLTGRTTLEYMKEEHGAEYHRKFGQGDPP